MKLKTDIARIDNVNFRGLMYFKTKENQDADCISFKSKYNGHEVSFYAWKDTGYKLQVGDFGFFEKGLWIQVEPTVHQIETMEDAIARKLHILHELEDEKEFNAMVNKQDQADIIKTSESIDFNFHRTF